MRRLVPLSIPVLGDYAVVSAGGHVTCNSRPILVASRVDDHFVIHTRSVRTTDRHVNFSTPFRTLPIVTATVQEVFDEVFQDFGYDPVTVSSRASARPLGYGISVLHECGYCLAVHRTCDVSIDLSNRRTVAGMSFRVYVHAVPRHVRCFCFASLVQRLVANRGRLHLIVSQDAPYDR